MILIIPYFCQFGYIFTYDSKMVYHAIIGIFYFIYALVTFSFFMIMSYLINFTTSPKIWLFASFNMTSHTIFIGVLFLVTSFMNILSSFSNHIVLILYIFRIIVTSYGYYDAFTFNYVSKRGRAYSPSLSTFFIISDIISIYHTYVTPIPMLWRILSPFIGFIISLPIMYYLVTSSIDKLSNQISNYDPENLPEFPSTAKSIRIIRAGFISMKVIVLNGCLGLHICKQHEDSKICLEITRMIGLIPGNASTFNEALEILWNNASKSFFQKIALFHLYMMKQNRDLVETSEIRTISKDLTNRSQASLYSITQFWKRIADGDKNLSLKSMMETGDLVLRSSELWEEGLKLYPMSSCINYGYAQFLLTVTRTMHAGFEYNWRSIQLQRHTNPYIDMKYSMLLHEMPDLFRHHILTLDGNFCAGSESASNNTDDEEQGDTSEEEIMQQISVTEKIDEPRLALAIERATKHFSPDNMRTTKIFKYRLFAICIIGLIVCVVLIMNPFDKIMSYLDTMEYYANVATGLNYAQTGILTAWAQNMSIFFDDFGTILPESALDESTSISLNSTVTTSYWIDLTYQNFIKLGEVTNSLQKEIQYPTCTKTKLDDVLDLSINSAIIRMISIYDIIIDDQSKFSTFKDYYLCGIVYIQKSLTDLLIQSQHTFALKAKSEAKKLKQKSAIILGVSLVLVAILIVAIIVPIFVLFQAINSVFREMTKVTINIQNMFKERLFEIDPSNYQQINTIFILSISLIVFIVFVLLSFASIIVLFCMTNSTSNDLIDLISIAPFNFDRNILVTSSFSTLTMLLISRETDISDIIEQDSLKTEITQNLQRLNQTNFIFKQGNGSIKGISEIDTEIMRFQSQDRCLTNQRIISRHESFKCLSFDGALSLYEFYVKNLMANSLTLQSDEYKILFHLTGADISNLMNESTVRITQAADDHIDYCSAINISFSVVLFVSLMLGAILLEIIESHFKEVLRFEMILIRHLPPSILTNSSLVPILLGRRKRDVEEHRDSSYMIFINCSTPALSIDSSSLLIESANDAFLNGYRFSRDQVVGRDLRAIIPDCGNSQELKIEDQNAAHFYEHLLEGTEKIAFSVNVECGDGVSVVSNVDAYRSDGSDKVMLILDNARQQKEAKDQLDSFKKENSGILAQLERGENEHAVWETIQNCTIIAVKLASYNYSFTGNKELLTKARELISTLLPPGYFFLNSTSIAFVCSPNNSTDESIALAQKMFKKIFEGTESKRMKMAIANGQISYLKNERTKVISDLIEVSASMINESEYEQILLSQETLDSMLNPMNLEKGPVVLGHQTYVYPVSMFF